jgi:hypothetical protein
MKTLHHIAATLLALSLGIDQAAAAPASVVNALSPYVGECVVLGTNNELVGARGVLQTVNETYAQLDVQGIPILSFMSHVAVAIVDADGRLGWCAEAQSADVVEQLRALGANVRP